MKKALSLILVLTLAVSMLCTVAFAEGSKTDVFNPVGSGSKTDVFSPIGAGSKTDIFNPSKMDLLSSLTINTKESELDAITAEEMAAALAEAEVEADTEKLVVVTQRDYTAKEFPVAVTFYGEGTEDVVVYQFVKYEGEDSWKLLYNGLAGEWEVEFEAAGTYAIAVLVD